MTRTSSLDTTGYTYYGYANGWKETPHKVMTCQQSNHEEHVVSLNTYGTLDRYFCPICKYYFDVDSS